MDAIDLLPNNLHTKKNGDSDVSNEIANSLTQVEQEEKRDDNFSFNDSKSNDDTEQDIDCPSTQLLALDLVDEEIQEKTSSGQSFIPFLVKTCASLAEPCKSPDKALVSSLQASTSSPSKYVESPANGHVSPVKTKSSLKCQSPVRHGLPPVRTMTPSIATLPLVERLNHEETIDDDIPEEYRAEGAEGKFTRVFSAVAKMVETGGWQIAYGHNSLFCAMPGVQFDNFKPNINVFDSKVKACWKFIQVAGEKEEDTENKELWEMLWSIAEKEFGWFTMVCGVETWYVKPDTKFENFQPNETIFQTKKRAVLKCLAVEVGEIELGDSIEGHQVVAFAPRKVHLVPTPALKKVKTFLFKTPSPATNRSTSRSNASAKFVTPAKHMAPSSSSSSAKRKLPSSETNMGSNNLVSKKKVKTGTKASAKRTLAKKKSELMSDTPSNIKKGDNFNFTPPEFRCSFGIVYAKLQDEGWYHRSGMFEYDYFSPTYTDATKVLNVNFFQSQADLEEFLKVSGTWKRIEDELREEHVKVVDEEREKALDRHHQRLEQQAARKRSIAINGRVPAVAKPKKLVKKVVSKTIADPSFVPQSLYQAEVEAARAAEAEEVRLSRMPKLKFGTVLKKLVKRGWYYRPGRFEYDYFKPSANPKSAVAGEDRFESASALEVYLKTTGMWEEIAEEVAYEEAAEQDKRSAYLESQDRSTKCCSVESPPLASTHSLTQTSNGGIQKEVVKAITNDIWANSHEFDFDE